MKIIFVRHGKDDSNYRGGWSNFDLIPEGVEQSKTIAEYLKNNLKKFNIAKVISSDLPRAVTTAKIISSKINLPFHTDTALREINNGNLSGMLNSEAEIKYPGLFFSSLKMDEHYPNGESPNEFYNRIKTWFHNFILQNADANSNILVVTHGGVIGIIYHLTNKIEWSNKQNNFKIPPGSIHILNIDTMQFE